MQTYYLVIIRTDEGIDESISIYENLNEALNTLKDNYNAILEDYDPEDIEYKEFNKAKLYYAIDFTGDYNFNEGKIFKIQF